MPARPHLQKLVERVRFLPELDMVLVLAVRSQREAGYDDHR